MGKFLDKQKELLRQTNYLREIVTNKTNVDHSNSSIAECAQSIHINMPDIEKPITIERYVRPDWYPNGDEILKNAPEIVKDNKRYYPCYYYLEDAYSTYNRYCRVDDSDNTYCDAYIFSDDINNDLTNATDSALIVGKEITHIWDTSKYFYNSDKSEAVRYFICYATSKFPLSGTGSWRPTVHRRKLIEFIINIEVTSSSYTFFPYQYTARTSTLKYAAMLDSCIYTSTTVPLFPTSGGGDLWPHLEEIRLPTWARGISGSIKAPKLKYINLENLENVSGIGAQTPNMSYLDLASLTTINNETFTNMNTKNIILGDKLHSILAASFKSLKNIEQLDFKTVKLVEPSGLCSYCYNLKSINFEELESLNWDSFCAYDYNLEKVMFPESYLNSCTTLTASRAFCDCYKLKNVQSLIPINLQSADFAYAFSNVPMDKICLPCTLTSLILNENSFNSCPYIELWNGFDISGVNFNDVNQIKSDKWLKDVCIWLKDKSNDINAGTIILGNRYKNRLSDYYVLYNPTTKEVLEWVTSETEGAISALEYITTVKNWTIS